MKKLLIVIAVILVFLALGYFFIFNSEESNNATQESQQSIEQVATDQTQEEQSDVDEGETQDDLSSTGEYIDYSEQAVAQNNGKTKIVFFHAEWCPNCRSLEKNILAGNIPEDMVILKANYDSEVELRQKLGVTTQTTMVQIDDQGNKVKLWVASAFDDIEAIKNEVI